MIIGCNGKQYQVIDGWGVMPAGENFGTTHGVTEDKSGRIIVHHTGRQSISIFTPEGKHLNSWGEDYAEGAHGLLLNEEDGTEFLYLSTTTQGFMAKTTLEGEEVFRIVTPPRKDIYNPEENKRFIPTQAAVAANGDIYITDGYGECWVHQYDKDANYIQSFGGRGSDQGKLATPHGITIDTRHGQERLLVADRRNRRMQYFTLDGKFDGMFNKDLRKPCGAVFFGDEMYIPDLHSRVSIFDKNNILILHLGDWDGAWELEGWPNLPESMWRKGYFSSPHDLHVDGNGDIYIAEWFSDGTGKMTKLILINH